MISETPIPATLSAVIGTDFSPMGIPDSEISGFIIQSEQYSIQDIATDVYDQLGALCGRQKFDRQINASIQVIGATPEANATALIGKTWELPDPSDNNSKQDYYVVSVTENGSYNGLRTWSIDLQRNQFWPKRKVHTI